MGQASPKIGRVTTWIYLAAVVLLPLRYAAADDLLGLYVGGAIGEARVEASGEPLVIGPNLYQATGRFDETHSAFKVMAGIRPIPLLGAEVAYMDFGSPSGGYNAYPARVSMHGESAFALIYLPIPVVDVFLKGEIDHMQSAMDGTAVYAANCTAGPCPLYVGTGPFRLDRTNTGLALGGGAQYKFGPLALRAEYERFSAAEAHPALLSVGLTWSF
jgi:opacity protein-like surface antigen